MPQCPIYTHGYENQNCQDSVHFLKALILNSAQSPTKLLLEPYDKEAKCSPGLQDFWIEEELN